MRQLLWHLYYIDTAIESSELYCYNTEGDIHSVVSQASCKMGRPLLELQAEAGIEKRIMKVNIIRFDGA